MKAYWEIPGPGKAPQQPCLAFYKYDGMNFRAEWTPKRGWHKFGSRHELIDENHGYWGGCVPLFLNTLADNLTKVFKHKFFRSVKSIIAYCEVYSANSFAGWFPQADGEILPQFPTGEPAQIKLIEVNLHKRGFVLPRDFVKQFGHLDNVAEVIYDGNFNKQFIQAVYDGEYELREGVIAKGVLAKKNPQHGLWMTKIKTRWWIEELRRRSAESKEFGKVLIDNIKEQGICS